MDTQTLIRYLTRAWNSNDRRPVSEQTIKALNIQVHENADGRLALYLYGGRIYIKTITKETAYRWIMYERKFAKRDATTINKKSEVGLNPMDV